AASADLLQQLIRADHRAAAFADWLIDRGDEIGGWRLQEAARLLVALQQPFDPLAQGKVGGASPVQEGGALGRVFFLQGLNEDGLFFHAGRSKAIKGSGSTNSMRHPGAKCARNLKKMASAGNSAATVRRLPALPVARHGPASELAQLLVDER